MKVKSQIMFHFILGHFSSININTICYNNSPIVQVLNVIFRAKMLGKCDFLSKFALKNVIVCKRDI